MTDPTIIGDATLLIGDVEDQLRTLPDESVQCVVTSPPYWGLRDYGSEGQIGLEETIDEYINRLMSVFDEVWRVLRTDGLLWLNMGDGYAGSWGAQGRNGQMGDHSAVSARQISEHPQRASHTGSQSRTPGLKPKDLIGMPWRIAFALQAAGWYLRSDIIWAKPNPMPESIRDRPTKSHEYLFLLSKAERYYYDAEAIKDSSSGRESWFGDCGYSVASGRNDGGSTEPKPGNGKRNKRTVWTVGTRPYREAHFATFPEALVEPCILAGSREGDTVLDPFSGTATTGVVALKHGRKYIGIDLSAKYTHEFAVPRVTDAQKQQRLAL